MSLYSYKGEYPQPLPDRIRLSNGITRTDASTFTQEEIVDAGYVLAPAQPNISKFQKIKWVTDKWEVTEMNEQEIEGVKAKEWERIREKRNAKLSNTDWMIIKAMETGTPIAQGLLNYRQGLRDITLQSDPFNIQWPDFIVPLPEQS